MKGLITLFLFMSYNSYAGSFCSSDELPCDISKIDTNRYETKITKNDSFIVTSNEIMTISYIDGDFYSPNRCKWDPEIIKPAKDALFMKATKNNVLYNDPSKKVKSQGCKISSVDFVDKKVLVEGDTCLKRVAKGYMQITVTCETLEVSTVTGTLSPKEIEAARCAEVVMCGSKIKNEKQLKLYSEMKKEFCGSREAENLSNIINVNDSGRGTKGISSESQPANTQEARSIQK